MSYVYESTDGVSLKYSCKILPKHRYTPSKLNKSLKKHQPLALRLCCKLRERSPYALALLFRILPHISSTAAQNCYVHILNVFCIRSILPVYVFYCIQYLCTERARLKSLETVHFYRGNCRRNVPL